MSGTRERWVYRTGDNGECIKFRVDPDAAEAPEVRTQISMDRHYENLQATDGSDIGSRRKHQEYMKRTGQVMADDYKQTWAKAKAERDAFHRGEFSLGRREDVARALYHHKHRR